MKPRIWFEPTGSDATYAGLWCVGGFTRRPFRRPTPFIMSRTLEGVWRALWKRHKRLGHISLPRPA